MSHKKGDVIIMDAFLDGRLSGLYYFVVLDVVGDDCSMVTIGNDARDFETAGALHSVKAQSLSDYTAVFNVFDTAHLRSDSNAPKGVTDSRHLCRCDTFQVVHFGCKCGGR